VPAKVTVQPFGEELDVERGESLLAAILRQGRFVQYGCKHGGCGTCRAHLVSGDCRLGASTSYALSDADRERGIVLLCSTFLEEGHAVVDVSQTMELTPEEFTEGRQVHEYLGTVDAIDRLSERLRGLRLRLLDPPEMAFLAGQYVEVEVPGGSEEWRAFSIASPPADAGRIELIIKLIPGGRFSRALEATLAPGDRLRMRGPFGQFNLRLSYRPMVMIASGSGIAPLRSMLYALEAGGNQREATLFYGARTDRDLQVLGDLRALERARPWFRLVPVLSEPERNAAPWNGETGPVLDAVLRRFPSLKGLDAYLCGPPKLIDDGVKVLEQAGCKPRHIYFERFVPSG
jgi:NAD(P)H-flavin reductase/ferredoxin